MTPIIARRNHYSADERQPAHAHGYTNLSIVLRGSLMERVGRVEKYAGPLSVVVKPSDTEHSDVFGPSGAILFQLRLPLAWESSLRDHLNPASQWRWLQSMTVARWMLTIAQHTHSQQNDDALDALAECLGAIANAGDSRVTEVPSWIRRIRERIADECSSGLRVTALAAEGGVHPVYLTREFRRAYGTSIVGCMQQDRVRRAAAALANTSIPISHVALNSGFVDQPHLTRIFRRECGMTPAQFRHYTTGDENKGQSAV